MTGKFESDNQTLLVADEQGNHTGEYISRVVAHSGNGKHHLAISVLLYNGKGQVLLQHRKHKIHNDIWDLTGSTHHLHKNNGKDETSEEATYRCLKREYGINSKVPLTIVGGINYFAADGKHCENEHDIILIGEYDGKIRPNKDVAYNHKWIDEKDFLKDIKKFPKKYAPWARLAAKKLKDYRPNLFKKELELFLAKYEPYSDRYFESRIKTAREYSNLASDFYKKLLNFSSGGKKKRAFFVWVGYQIGGGVDVAKILPISLAFEMTQNFLLIHDDIIDNSDLRRGKPTVHKIYEKKHGKHYGESMAITLGDVAAVEVFRLINSSAFSDKLKVISQDEFSKILLETAYGQSLDIEYGYKKPSFKKIMQIADLKTARYSIVGPLVIGAKLAGAKESQIEALTLYGLSVGLAFQIHDDILGVFGNEKVLGKSILSDLREGKNTILIYRARKLANNENKNYLDKIWGDKSAKINDLKKVQDILRKSGALRQTEVENKKLSEKAKTEIVDITSDEKLQLILNQIVDFVINRKK
jgi:geranylgeranyl diphosphate synthase, type I